MKVAIVTGVCVEGDAISASVVSQARLLLQFPEIESVDVFSQHIERDVGTSAHQVDNPWKLLNHPSFASADLAIFHWGIHYDLFDAIVAMAPSSRCPVPVVHFHNCTPRELVDQTAAEAIDRSMRQLQLIPANSVRCWTFSPFNTATLVDIGVDPADIAFVPFPIESPRHLIPRRRRDGVDVAVVGRIVPAKGHHVLIDALALLPERVRQLMKVSIAGNVSFSSLDYLGLLEAQVARLGLEQTVTFVGQPNDDDLWALYERSHLLVSPSLHEGLCVPVIEAYIAGCRVVGVRAGNLPFVIQPPDQIVAPNDAAALADAMSTTVAEIVDDVSVDRSAAKALVNQFSRVSTAKSLRAELAKMAHTHNKPEGAPK